jgi:hypothetical protein
LEEVGEKREKHFDTLEFSGGEDHCSIPRWKSKADSSVKVRKLVFAEKRKEWLHGVMWWDLETGSPLGQVGNQVL